MSEARALTNFAGNAVATVVIGRWVGQLDSPQVGRVLRGEAPFDESTMLDEDDAHGVPTTDRDRSVAVGVSRVRGSVASRVTIEGEKVPFTQADGVKGIFHVISSRRRGARVAYSGGRAGDSTGPGALGEVCVGLRPTAASSAPDRWWRRSCQERASAVA
jgi:hypothetical protein